MFVFLSNYRFFFISYMEFVRHRVERAFIDPIKLLLRGCSIEARNRPRITKTGEFLTS